MKYVTLSFVAVSVLRNSSAVLAEGMRAKASEHAVMYLELFAKLVAIQDGIIDIAEAKTNKALGESFAKAAKDGKMPEEKFAKRSSSHAEGLGKPKS